MNLKDLEYRYGLKKWMIELLLVIHSLLLFAFDSLLLLVPSAKTGGRATGKNRLLVIKLDAIGDFILWLDFACGLRTLYSAETTEITLLANRSWADLAEHSSLFNRVIPISRMRFILNPFYRFKTLLAIRRSGFDVVIDPAFSREFQFSPPVARVSGAGVRIASQGDLTIQRGWQKKISDRAYNRFLSSSSRPMMELVRNAEFLRHLGYEEFKAGIPLYPGFPAHNRKRTSPYYIIFPGAGWVNRQWPVGHFAELASRIYTETGWTGIICGGPGEEHLGRAIRTMTRAPLEDRIGRTNLHELAALVREAAFLIGNESSGIHLAAAVGTPTVCILGGGHFGRFVPYQIEATCTGAPPQPVFERMDCYGCNWHCIFPIKGEQPVPCISRITVEAAWNAIRDILGRKTHEKKIATASQDQKNEQTTPHIDHNPVL